jgi:hypothetical protein
MVEILWLPVSNNDISGYYHLYCTVNIKHKFIRQAGLADTRQKSASRKGERVLLDAAIAKKHHLPYI